MLRPRPLVPALAVVAGACMAEPTTVPGRTPETPGHMMNPGGTTKQTSYLRDVQPIVERACLGCHTTDGIAPFSLQVPEEAAGLAPLIRAAVVDRRMPPFMAGEGCTDYLHDSRLSAEEIAAIVRWADEGGPLGDPAEARHAEARTAPAVRQDLVMDLRGDFDASTMQDDLYRCFVLDPELTEDVAITGYQVMPGNRAIVHHVLAYAVEPAQVPELEQLDAADPGMGYTCFGGPKVSGAAANQIAGWVPGQVPRKLAEGTALELKAGSRIAMQIHYNLLSPGDAPPLDNTKLALELAPSRNGLTLARSYPLAQRRLDIPAGDPEVVAQANLRIPRLADGAVIYGVTGHMHQLGTAFRLEIERASGAVECLLDIPRWDFAWQQSFELAAPVTLHTGDEVNIRCTYDNSAANQPVVGGQRQAPRNVTWGEGSLDEMCLGYLYATRI